MLNAFYPKQNVPTWERVLRIAIGLVLIGFALSGESLLGHLSPALNGLGIISAVMVVLTGFVGWCPACALVGRKIKSKQTKA